MAYNIISRNGDLIHLSEEVWHEHINVHHPEVTIEELILTLENPVEIRLSQIRLDVELYYRLKSSSNPERVRYWMVIVKRLPGGNFVSSAMTKTKIVGGKLIYQRL